MTGIIDFENANNWQATAEDVYGRRIAVMRGQSDGRFEGKYYLYDEDWIGTSVSPSGEMKGYSAEIQDMFTSGDLKRLKGEVPK